MSPQSLCVCPQLDCHSNWVMKLFTHSWIFTWWKFGDDVDAETGWSMGRLKINTIKTIRLRVKIEKNTHTPTNSEHRMKAEYFLSKRKQNNYILNSSWSGLQPINSHFPKRILSFMQEESLWPLATWSNVSFGHWRVVWTSRVKAARDQARSIFPRLIKWRLNRRKMIISDTDDRPI